MTRTLNACGLASPTRAGLFAWTAMLLGSGLMPGAGGHVRAAVVPIGIVPPGPGGSAFVCGVDGELAGAARQGTGGGAELMASSPYTEGVKRLLLIRVDFEDLAGDPFTEAAGLGLLDGVREHYLAASYHRTRFEPAGAGSAVTPTLRMPRPAAYYGTNNLFNQLRADARAAADAAGFARELYDFDATAIGWVPGLAWTGLGNVGTPGVWIRGTASVAILVHELGHNFGLNHANFWDTAGRSVIGAGASVEYGDIFDIMGSGGVDLVFNARYKQYLNWLKPDEWIQAASNGTYRLFAHDATNHIGLVRALSVAKNNGTNYWLEFRHNVPGQPWLSQGAQLRWALAGNQSTLLLDTAPGSPQGKNDAPILIGQTFSDRDLGLHITVQSMAGTEPASLDVVVNRGAFFTNAPPVLEVAAGATQASIDQAVDFAAAAVDPNGDTLAYFWDFGDGSFGGNSPWAQHAWTAPGEYVIRCVVSDMKGGRASDSILVVVGVPGTHRISGAIQTEAGVPVEGARVFASGGPSAYSDSDGAYALIGLGPGAYTVEAGLDGFEFFHPAFANPVQVGPNAEHVDFVARLEPGRDRVPLIPPGSLWRYLDDGSDPGTAWRESGFDDTNWALGPAQLGYGDADEVTLVDFGGDPNNKFITTYFRHILVVDDPLQFGTLTLALLRDDGAVVYLNGQEIVRSNMPEGPVDYLTRAVNNVGAVEERMFFETPLLSSQLVPGANVIAVEVHQEDRNSGDLSFDLSVLALRLSDLPVGVFLASPAPDANYIGPTNVLLSANARAPDPEAIVGVEFFQGTHKLGQAGVLPYSMVWSNPPFGAYRLTARAWDSAGRCLTSSPVDITVSSVLIARGSAWKFHDLGIDLGQTWVWPEYEDGDWPSGPAQLGYGDGDERTLVDYGTNPNSKYITTYFRHRLDVMNASVVTQLTYRLLRDDGAVVYLNGIEQFRSNMPAPGPVAFSTLALESAGGLEERTFYEARVPSTALASGMNVVAVEVHQESGSSSDLSFDLELFATGPGPPLPPALAWDFDGQRFRLTWPSAGAAAGWRLYASSSLHPGASWDLAMEQATTDQDRTVVVVAQPLNGSRFFRLQCDTCSP